MAEQPLEQSEAELTSDGYESRLRSSIARATPLTNLSELTQLLYGGGRKGGGSGGGGGRKGGGGGGGSGGRLRRRLRRRPTPDKLVPTAGSVATAAACAVGWLCPLVHTAAEGSPCHLIAC